MTFNNLIEIIVEIREIALLNRATPGSSLVNHKVSLKLPKSLTTHLKNEYHEYKCDDDLEQVDHQTDDEVGQGELSGCHPRHPRPVQQSLIPLDNDDHGRVTQGHRVDYRQDDT